MRISSKFATIVLVCLGLALSVLARAEPSFKLDSNVGKGGVSRDAATETALLAFPAQQEDQVGLSEQSGATFSTLPMAERRGLKSKSGKPKKKKKNLKKIKGAAIGSTTGVIIFGVIVLAILFFIWRAKKKEKDPKWRARDMFKSSDKDESASEKTKTAGDKEGDANKS